jgi:hypothetical protein
VPRARGIVLFVALLVLVVLGLASMALLRAAETTTLVAGHLASSQAAIAAVDRGIEQAIGALWGSSPLIIDRTRHDPAQNYYACVLASAGTCLIAGSAIPEIPSVLESPSLFAAAGLNTNLVEDDAAGHSIDYLIERLCLGLGAPLASHCNLPASAPSGGQSEGTPQPSPDAYYRVTVKVTGPRNTAAYAQALLRPPRDGGAMRRVSWRLIVTE